MLKRRSLTIFATAFGLVLFAGVAFAQVGPFAPDEPAGDAPMATDDEPTVTTKAEPEPTTTTVTTEPVEDEAHESDEPAGDETDKDDSDGDDADHEDSDEPKGDDEHEDEPSDTPPADTTAPDFAILHPTNGQHVDDKSIAFEGEVEPGARVFAGDYEADVADDGSWRIVLVLNAGQNVATLRAVDEAGNVTTDTVTVHYDVPHEDPKDDEPGDDGEHEDDEPEDDGEHEGEEPHEVDFSANQKFGSCGEEVPYDVFWGTANPGATVYVVSDFGSGTTTANDDGHWELRVEFPDAPFGDSFNVVVEADGGGREVFTFVRTTGDGEHDG